MKKIKYLLLLFISFPYWLRGYSYSVRDTVIPIQIKELIQKAYLLKDTLQVAQNFQVLGQHYYDKQPEQSLIYLDSAAFYFDKMGKKKENAICLQNMAFLLEEQMKVSYISLKYANESLRLWSEIGNPLAQANLLKYIGLLYGNLGQYDKAFEVIEQSIQKFKSKNYLSGIAVCQFDKAMVYKKQMKYELSKKCLIEAKTYWVQQKDTGRIFGINNVLIEIEIGSPKLTNIQNCITENQNFVSDNIYWKEILDFYTHCTVFYNHINDNEKLLTYKNLKGSYIEKCRLKGYKVD